MRTLTELESLLSVSGDVLDRTMPGAFVDYNSVSKKSSKVDLASSIGFIRKTKERSPEKAVYEFFALTIWNRLLEAYSAINNFRFRAPHPHSIQYLNDNENSLIMEYLNGYELQKLSNLKRTTPVEINGQIEPLPVYPACALHLGALNRIKEVEGLFHADYDSRHIIFSPIQNVSIGVVDVENSRLGERDAVLRESSKIMASFEPTILSERDRQVLKTWHEIGYMGLTIPARAPLIPSLVRALEQEYDFHFDFKDRVINGYQIPYTKSY